MPDRKSVAGSLVPDSPVPDSPVPHSSIAGVGAAFAAFATGVTLVTIADGRDDIGTTVSAFCPVSLDPPLVLISLMASSYPAEVLVTDPPGPGQPGTEQVGTGHPRASRAGTGRFAVTVLSAGQRMLAGRFAVAGRPGARLLLDGIPHHRGTESGALIPDGGLAALECAVVRRVPAGDHLLVISAVTDVAYVAESGEPLVRFRGRYPALG